MFVTAPCGDACLTDRYPSVSRITRIATRRQYRLEVPRTPYIIANLQGDLRISSAELQWRPPNSRPSGITTRASQRQWRR